MKIKGFKSLIKAVRNRAHLVPVMTLINGKFKTYYGKRYVSPGEAMETAKEDFKINPYQEAIFESKDGKVKNITEKEVLKMYDEAGKPGVLQDFIKKNFKRPKVKASTKDNGQLSFDNMMQDSKPTENAKIKDNKQETQVDDKETQRKERKLNFYRKKYSNGSLEIDVENMGNVLDSNGVPAEKESDIRKGLIFQFNTEINYMKNNAPFSDINSFDTIKKDYERHKVLREALTSKDRIGPLMYRGTDKIDYWQKAVEVGVFNLNQLYDFDNDYKNGKYDKYDAALDYIPRMLCQQGANVWGRYDMKRLYFNAAGDSVADRIASEQNMEKDSEDYDALKFYTSSMYLDLNKDKLYIEKDGANNKYLDGSTREKILSYAREKINELESQKTGDENKPSKDSIMTIEQEKMLIRRLKARRMQDNPFKIKADEWEMIKLTDTRGVTINGVEIKGKRAYNIERTLQNIDFDLNTGKVSSFDGADKEILSMAQDAIDKVVSDIKAETQGSEPDLNALAEQNQALEEKRAKQRLRENSKEYIEENRKRTTLDDLNARDRFGTKKIESKGEYKQVSNINELIDKAKAIKDYHVDVKGRAILDMLGVNLPMYSKRNGKPFSGKNLGYCRSNINDETGEVIPYEIGIVAETGNSTEETGAIIHEAMHARIKGISQNILNKCLIKGGLLEKEVQHNVEESLVEMAGFSLAKTIHGSDNYKEIMAYPEEIALTLPRIWGVEEFKNARKTGINGIGKEIYNQIMSGNKEFIDKIANTYVSDEAKDKANKRTAAIEKTMLDRTDKLEAITGGNEKSPIGNLVEELKRGTISLEVALNSSEYGAIAAVLITKFLEDEDLDGIDALIGSL